MSSFIEIPLQLEVSKEKLPEYLRHVPSVDFGPISTEKAKRMFNWTPTNFEEALKVLIQIDWEFICQENLPMA